MREWWSVFLCVGETEKEKEGVFCLLLCCVVVKVSGEGEFMVSV